jgi:(2R)-3-sulfolactate dehydrogenase (NADP+)
MADSTARALVLAESQGLGSHGLSRVAQYATHLRNGRVNGAAVPQVLHRKGGALVVDAQEGLAFPACELAVREAVAAAQTQGVALPAWCAATTAAWWSTTCARRLRRAWSAWALPTRRRPCRRPAAGTRSSAPTRWRRSSRARGGPADDRPEPERSRARQADGGGQGRQAHPRRLGAGRRGQPTTDPKAGWHGSMLPIGAVSAPRARCWPWWWSCWSPR